MPDHKTKNKAEHQEGRIKITSRISITAYDAITDIQRNHRKKWGRHLPQWKIVETAILTYAKERGITPEKGE
jgi:hypothetical protein